MADREAEPPIADRLQRVMRRNRRRWWRVAELAERARCSHQGARDALAKLVAQRKVSRRSSHPAFEYRLAKTPAPSVAPGMRITPRQLAVMESLRWGRESSAAEVAKASAVPDRTVRYWLNRFQQTGWVERRPGRPPMFRLTAAGYEAKLGLSSGDPDPREPASHQPAIEPGFGMPDGSQPPLFEVFGN